MAFNQLNKETLELIQNYVIARIEHAESLNQEPDVHMFEDLGRIAYQLYQRDKEEEPRQSP
jgi:hypothetical protein